MYLKPCYVTIQENKAFVSLFVQIKFTLTYNWLAREILIEILFKYTQKKNLFDKDISVKKVMSKVPNFSRNLLVNVIQLLPSYKK